MDKAFQYTVQDASFFDFAVKLILGAILTPLWILLMPFYNAFRVI